MKEEEKKAIELLEDIKNNTWTTKYIMSSDSKNAKVLLNLIEKLQKENEELRAKWDKDTHILQNELDLTNADKINNYIPVQKVKDKIEELNDESHEEELEDIMKKLYYNRISSICFTRTTRREKMKCVLMNCLKN